MSILVETNIGGDLIIDLDVQGSPALCRNFLKLVKARQYTNTLIYNVQADKFCQCGDPLGNGTGGASIYAYVDQYENNNSGNKAEDTAAAAAAGTPSQKKEHSNVELEIQKSTKRFLKSQGRLLSTKERQEKGRVVAVEMNGIPDTIGSQFLITLAEGSQNALDDGIVDTSTADNKTSSSSSLRYLSLGVVAEDDFDILDKLNTSYCDSHGRPYTDIRIVRALVVHDPFEDPPGFAQFLEQQRGVHLEDAGRVTRSPSHERPPEEVVEKRIQAHQVEGGATRDDDGEDQDTEEYRQKLQQQQLLEEEQVAQKNDQSRAVVLEMLGDLPSAEMKAPDNVLFVCKLNPATDDEDLELIFSRFDQAAKAEIIRDPETGVSLQYAFVEFTNKEQCTEAYFKMNNALVDDRRIKVDFSQSVAKVWDKYAQRMRKPPQQQSQTATKQPLKQYGNTQHNNDNYRAGRKDGGGPPFTKRNHHQGANSARWDHHGRDGEGRSNQRHYAQREEGGGGGGDNRDVGHRWGTNNGGHGDESGDGRRDNSYRSQSHQGRSQQQQSRGRSGDDRQQYQHHPRSDAKEDDRDYHRRARREEQQQHSRDSDNRDTTTTTREYNSQEDRRSRSRSRSYSNPRRGRSSRADSFSPSRSHSSEKKGDHRRSSPPSRERKSSSHRKRKDDRKKSHHHESSSSKHHQRSKRHRRDDREGDRHRHHHSRRSSSRRRHLYESNDTDDGKNDNHNKDGDEDLPAIEQDSHRSRHRRDRDRRERKHERSHHHHDDTDDKDRKHHDRHRKRKHRKRSRSRS